MRREWLGVKGELWDMCPLTASLRDDPAAGRKVVAKYRKQVVLPRMRAWDAAWFQSELGKLTAGIVCYRDIAPPLRPWKLALRRARWGRVMWRLFKTWAVARVTSEIPVVVWRGSRVGRVAPHCALCGQRCGVAAFVAGLRWV